MVTQARSPLRVTSHLPDYAYTEFSLILSPEPRAQPSSENSGNPQPMNHLQYMWLLSPTPILWLRLMSRD